jgi:hypothetical protein
MAEPRRAASVRSIASEALDWDFLIEAAIHNETLPLLYWHVSQLCPEKVPPALLNELRTYFVSATARGMQQIHGLIGVLDLLKQHGIRCIPFKGPVLAQTLFGNIALRPAGDLDIFVEKSDVPLVTELLLGDGYSLRRDMTEGERTNHLESDYHFEFHKEDRNLHLEVHWSLLPAACGAVQTAYLWKCAKESSLAGQHIFALPSEELFVLLCVHHGVKHEWARLKWIGDIAWMISTCRDIEWRLVFERARALGHERAVFEGCFIASSLFSLELPEYVGEVLAHQAALPGRAALVRGRIFRRGHGLPGFREWLAYVNAAGVSPSNDRVKRVPAPKYLQYLRAVATPEFNDRYAFRLPGPLSAFHYLYRPARLFKEHRSGLLQRLH